MKPTFQSQSIYLEVNLTDFREVYSAQLCVFRIIVLNLIMTSYNPILQIHITFWKEPWFSSS